ncbi:MAG: MFS transporter [Aeromicrobium erythreum]
MSTSTLDAPVRGRDRRDPRAPRVPTVPVPTGRARTTALLVLLVASAMELMDASIVNVALPSIEADFGATGAQLQWMVAGYPLAFAVAMITGSRLGDAFGRKRLFVGGLVAFTVMSAACGLATDAGMLVAFRALQGLGAAAMIPQVMSSLQVMYAPHERAKAMGAFAGLAGVATVLGPIVGALLTELDLAGTGWRAVFLVNVPIGVAVVVAAVKVVPESRAERAPRFDAVGLLLLAGGLLAVLYPLTLGRELGWPVWVHVLMVAGGVSLVGFVRIQRRLERTGREPLVATSLYRDRSFAAGTSFLGLLFVAMSAYFVALTIFLQAGLGWSVLEAGLVNVPFALTTAVAAGVGVGVLAPRFGRRVLQVGAVVAAVGFLAVAWTVHHADATTSGWAFVPAFVVAGLGFGLVVAPIGAFTLANVPVHHAGSASGLFNTTTQLANAVGVAVLGTVFFQVAQDSGSTVPADALGSGVQVVLVLGAVLLAAASVVARALPRTMPQDPTTAH